MHNASKRTRKDKKVKKADEIAYKNFVCSLLCGVGFGIIVYLTGRGER